MSKKKGKQKPHLKEIRNTKAYHNYNVGQKTEAGIALKGTEVKSIRAGNAQLVSSFIKIEKGNTVLYHAYIAEYAFGNVNNHDPWRPRRLLLHKKEIQRFKFDLEAKGKTLIPLRMYFKKGLVKIEIALCTGKHLHDKRETLKRKTIMREAERDLRRH